MKLFLLFFGSLFVVCQVSAQAGLSNKDVQDSFTKLSKKPELKDTTYLNFGGVTVLDFSQIYLKNWAGGGLNSASGKGLLSLYLNYRKNKFTWDNTLDLGYGLVRQFDSDPNDNVNDGVTYKSDDKIDFQSKLGRHAFNKFYYSGLVNFRTQFAPGFKEPTSSVKISDFMSPGYLIISAGLDYKPKDGVTFFLSPITSKTTFVFDDSLSAEGAFGIEENTNIRNEIGGYFKMQFKTNLADNITYTTRLDLFSNYVNNPQNIDVSWENLLSIQVWKLIGINISTHLIYDDDIKSREVNVYDLNGFVIGTRKVAGVQFKQVLGAGLTYKF